MVDKTTDPTPDSITLSMGDLSAFVQQKVDEALAQAAASHEETLAAMRLLIPDHTVPMHGGGPGISKAASWSLAQQESSQRGDYTA